jgi:sugar (pentulose or hexulose) kinase
MPLVLGIDIGIKSVKAGVFDAEGQYFGISRQNYTPKTTVIDHQE